MTVRWGTVSALPGQSHLTECIVDCDGCRSSRITSYLPPSDATALSTTLTAHCWTRVVTGDGPVKFACSNDCRRLIVHADNPFTVSGDEAGRRQLASGALTMFEVNERAAKNASSTVVTAICAHCGARADTTRGAADSTLDALGWRILGGGKRACSRTCEAWLARGPVVNPPQSAGGSTTMAADRVTAKRRAEQAAPAHAKPAARR